ncbi:NucA/NucB deoxyribonuclease domain-containing protein [Streptomyces sp. NPDC050743]|uniref:NucA/NucB deoxyribonuclease domain-containing protein n=1 Tax=Streptomyces sp. NPDC050743 TaxID=3365634 RepID=UPI0037B6F406
MYLRRFSLAVSASTVLVLGLFSAGPAQAGTPTGLPLRAASSSGSTCQEVKVPALSGNRACLLIEPVSPPPLAARQREERVKALMASVSRMRPNSASDGVQAAGIPSSFPTPCLGVVTGANNVLDPDRFHSCSSASYSATVVTVPGGATIGRMPLTVLQWTTDHAAALGTAAAWDHGVDVTTGTGTGVLAGGVQLSFTSLCTINAGICTVTATSGTQPAVYTSGSETTVIYNEADAGPASSGLNAVTTATSKLGIQWVETYNNLTATWSDNGTFQSAGRGLANRCDSYLGIYSGINANAQACVNETFTPTLTYSAVTNPAVSDVAQHVYNAQASLPSHWGVPAYGNWLSRDTDLADQADNRMAACTGVLPSCDEFPLASTHQGAAFSAPGDWSAVTVSASANSAQGGITGAFYTSNRVVEADKFWVKAVLANGSASW